MTTIKNKRKQPFDAATFWLKYESNSLTVEQIVAGFQQLDQLMRSGKCKPKRKSIAKAERTTPAMNLKTNKTINNLVDQIPSHVLNETADRIVASEDFNESGIEAYQAGVEYGLALAKLVNKRSNAAKEYASVYVAEQEVIGGGFNLIYFVGKASEIIAKLRIIVRS